MSKHDWTDEQVNALDLFRGGYSIRIQALAGCGKTTILKEMARNTKGNVSYLAFNTEMARESKREFPRNTSCLTTHALVYNQLPPELVKKAKRGFGLEVRDVMRFLEKNRNIRSTLLPHTASRVLQALNSFCISTDESVNLEHVADRLMLESENESDNDVVEMANSVWHSVVHPDGELRLTHDAYLKRAYLAGIQFDCDHILVDEVQDLNPLALAIINCAECQVVYVGDQHQQLYEWRGAVNSMDKVSFDKQARLTQSFRVGARGAEIANMILRRLGDDVLRPNPKIVTEVATRHQKVRLVRSNTTLFVKTVERADQRQRVHILGGTEQLESLVNDVETLQIGQPVWSGVFSGYRNWQQAQSRIRTGRSGSLSTFVKMADRVGVERMRNGLKKLPRKEADADVVLGTVHSAKGREWPAVSVYHDFKGDEVILNCRLIPAEQFRLVYVAVTRAMKALFIEKGVSQRFEL